MPKKKLSEAILMAVLVASLLALPTVVWGTKLGPGPETCAIWTLERLLVSGDITEDVYNQTRERLDDIYAGLPDGEKSRICDYVPDPDMCRACIDPPRPLIDSDAWQFFYISLIAFALPGIIFLAASRRVKRRVAVLAAAVPVLAMMIYGLPIGTDMLPVLIVLLLYLGMSALTVAAAMSKSRRWKVVGVLAGVALLILLWLPLFSQGGDYRPKLPEQLASFVAAWWPSIAMVIISLVSLMRRKEES